MTSVRATLILEKLQSGRPYDVIAKELEVSTERVRQFAKRYEKELSDKSPRKVITLPIDLWEYIKERGNGDLSKGIELIVRQHKE